MPEVSIVIVNHNTKEYLRHCLSSLRQNADVDAEIIVVENASPGGTQDIPQEFPEIRLLVNKQRLGFARNNNLGAEASTAPILLFLNPDTITPPGGLRAMLDVIAREPHTAVFGGRCLDPNGAIERSTGRDPTLSGILADRILTFLPPIWPVLHPLSHRHYSGFERDRDVDWVTGAYFWIRAEIFHGLGGWDSSIDMYYEDADLCRRVRDAGHGVRYIHSSTIYHHRGKTPISTDHRKEMMRTSLHIFLRKHYGPLRRWLYPRLLNLPRVDLPKCDLPG